MDIFFYKLKIIAPFIGRRSGVCLLSDFSHLVYHSELKLHPEHRVVVSTFIASGVCDVWNLQMNLDSAEQSPLGFLLFCS